MTDRTVSVRLRMLVHDYTSGAGLAARATNRLADELARLERQASGVGKGLDSAARKVTTTAAKFDAAAVMYEGSSQRFASSSALWEDHAGRFTAAADKLGAASKTVQQSAGRHDRAAKRYEDGTTRWVAASDRFKQAARTHETAAGRLGTVSFGGEAGKSATETADAFTDAAGRVAGATAVVAANAAVAGGALQFIAPAAVAAGAAAGTLPGLLGGAAASMGTLKVASIGVGDALGDLFETDDPFSRLSPRARALVAEVGRLKPELQAMQQTLQDTAYADAAANLDRLAATTLPVLSRQADMLAASWNRTGTALTDAATDAQVLSAVGTVSATTARFLDQVNMQLVPLSRALSMVAVSADPLTRLIGDRLTGSLDSFSRSIARAKATGDLDEFFQAGTESAGELLSIAGDLLTITGQVIGAVNRQGSAISGTADSLAAYVASGRSAEDMAGIVDTLTAAYEGMAQVLGPLGSIARDALADPGTRDALATMFDILATGSAALRVVFDLFQSLPDPVQSVVIAAVALGIVINRTTKGLTVMSAAATGAAARLTALGSAGAVAGRGLSLIAAGSGPVLAALIALQLAGEVLKEFEPAAANVDRLTESIEKFAKTGQASGELARIFGDDLEGLNKAANAAASDGWLANLGRSAEKILPPIKSINEIVQGGSFLGSAERFEALDSALARYAQTTNDTKGVTAAWNAVLSKSGLDAQQLADLMPQATAELTRLQDAAHAGAGGVAALEARTRTLAGGLEEAVSAGRDIIDVFNELNGKAIKAAEAESDVEASLDELTEGLKKNGRALNKRGTDFDVTTAKGRENRKLTIAMIEDAAEFAQAKYDESGSVEQASGVYDRYIDKLRTALGNQKLTKAQVEALIDRYGQMPELKATQVSAPGVKQATGDVNAFGSALKAVPPSKRVPFYADTGEAVAAVNALKSKIAQLQSKHIYITGSVRWTSNGDFKVPGGTQLRRWGGVDVAMAGGGTLQAGIYPASNPPLVKFAEPETGGEAYIPRRGDRRRNLAILGEVASWNDAAVVPMAAGGVTAAANGLVTVGPSTAATPTARGTALESIEAYIQARDAIARLNAELRKNGRSFSLSTEKGREHYSMLISAVKAAEDAAQAKFDETGSVKKANAAYDAHIAKLRAVLKQQKVSASTINALLKQVKRPTYDTPTGKAPVGSGPNIAAAEARIAAEDALSGLADHFSLVRPTFAFGDETGRDNLTELFAFLKAAERAAQTVFEQTGNSKTATGVYSGYVAQLRRVLAGSGLTGAAIDALLNQYGKIVLQPNRIGGVYARSGLLSLSEGGMFDAGRTLYGFAEPGTGGELFLPRLGPQRRGEELLSVGAGWYGGRYLPAGAASSAPRTFTNSLTVHAGGHRLTVPELQGMLRQMDARARIGRAG